MATNLIFDFGTTSLKVALVTDGVITAERNGTYHVDTPQPGWAEQSPDHLWETAGRLSRDLVCASGASASAQVDSVLFIAPWKGVTPVGIDGEVLCPTIIWLDGRAEKQARRLNEVLESCGLRSALTSQDYLPRLLWMKEEMPEVWGAADRFMGVTTFLRYRATGEVVSDPSDDVVHHNDLCTAATGRHVTSTVLTSEELAKFPQCRPADSIIGPLTAAACAHLGLDESAPVINGFGDLPAITSGVGPVRPGATHIYIGTSSWVARVAKACASEPRSTTSFTFDADTTVELYPLQTGALAFDWLVEELYGHERAHLSSGFLDHINEIVRAVPAGSENLLATHWLHGELPPFTKTARGMFLNLTTSHRKAHMVRAMMESICYTHRLHIEALEARHDVTSDPVQVVGGGASSDVWMQMLADVLDRRVVVPVNPRYTGVMGGERCVVSARGGPTMRESPRRAIPEGKTFSPDPANRDTYDHLFSIYATLHPALEGIFERLNGTVEEHAPPASRVSAPAQKDS